MSSSNKGQGWSGLPIESKGLSPEELIPHKGKLYGVVWCEDGGWVDQDGRRFWVVQVSKAFKIRWRIVRVGGFEDDEEELAGLFGLALKERDERSTRR